MMTKLRIKVGDIEVESEADEQFIRKELLEIVSATVKLHENSAFGSEPVVNGAEGRQLSPTRTSRTPAQLTTGTIAAKLGANSGPDLILAASAQLTFVQNKD